MDVQTFRIDALGKHIVGDRQDIDVAGALPVSEQRALNAVSPCEQRQLGCRHAAAAVVVRMHRENYVFPVLEMSGHPFNLIRIDIRRIHLDRSTLQRDVVFGMSRPEIIQIAAEGTKLVKEYAKAFPGKIILEYSPESFTGTELDFALEICTAVQEIWQPTPDNKIIFNLPSTVNTSLPAYGCLSGIGSLQQRSYTSAISRIFPMASPGSMPWENIL